MTMFDDPNRAWETWQRVARQQRRDHAHPSGPEHGIVTRDDACSALNGVAQLIAQALKSGGRLEPMQGSVAVMLLLAARDYVLPLPEADDGGGDVLVDDLREIVEHLRTGPFAPQ